MEIEKITNKDLCLNISRNAIIEYRTAVVKNDNEDELQSYLKLKRDFLLGNVLKVIDNGEIRNYGNLMMKRVDEANLMTGLYNKWGKEQKLNDDYKLSQQNREKIERILGLDRLITSGKIEDGFYISTRCYRNYIKDYQNYEDYFSLLHKLIGKIKYEYSTTHSWNDKTRYSFLDGLKVTVTHHPDGIEEITNIYIIPDCL